MDGSRGEPSSRRQRRLRRFSVMNVLIFMIPIALCLGGGGLWALLWALRAGQYDDIEGAEYRMLDDD